MPLLRRITDFSRDDLVAWCVEHGQPAFRADQIRRWIFGKRVSDFESMHDLPARVRSLLAEEFELLSTKVVTHQVAQDRTEKLLLELTDGQFVETVLMREEDRVTVCVSTQVGCAMGCVFCASGMLGLKRSLTNGEILEQILHLDRLLPLEERITNIVVMGIGEPLANLRNLLPAMDTLNDKGAMGIGARRITISTVGLPEKMEELAGHGKPYNLAVSLHAPNDELRTTIVPVNDKIGIEAILKAADGYFDKTGRRVTYEYVLLADVNDRAEHARELAKLLRGRHAHVNLIPMNDVRELPYHHPEAESTRVFIEILKDSGTPCTIRKRKGADIDAACGQLRLKHESRESELAVVSVGTPHSSDASRSE